MRRFARAVCAAGVLFGAASSVATAAPVVHTTDFIADSSRTNFGGFESLGGGFGFPNDYTENSIRVRQISSEPNDIWTTYFTPEGERGWYPSGGDFGYTLITRADSSNFMDVGLLRGSGFGSIPLTLFYELWDDGNLVLAGSLPHTHTSQGLYLGFSGGGYDEVRLWDRRDGVSNSQNALAIDAIELADEATTAVPEPASLALLGVGLAGLALRWRRR